MSKSAKPRRRLAFSIQTKILIASAALMACMMAFSVTVVVLGSELGKIALDLYDKSFVSVHYAHKVQTAFVRLEALHTDADLPLKADDEDYRDLEYFLSYMSNGIPIVGPGTRP